MRIGYFIGKPALAADEGIKKALGEIVAAGNETYDINRGGIRADTDMLLSFGGDGTFLSAARSIGDSKVPVLGVNLGRLGFLADCSLADLTLMLSSGSYTIEDRTMLQLAMDGGPDNLSPFCLNEISLSRTGVRMLGIDVCVDGRLLPTYWADGMLIGTSSGSTAYNLSAGGPVCMPGVRDFLITPVAPHNLGVRTLVVPGTSEVGISAFSRNGEDVLLTVDNRHFPIRSGSRLTVRTADFPLRKVCPTSSDFFNTLKTKLFWGRDIRNTIDQ